MPAALQDQIASALEVLKDALTDPTSSCALNPVPKRVIDLYPGISVAWDDCCNGQLSFQLVALQPKYDARRGRSTPCNIDWWSCTIRLDLLRCTPTVGNNQVPPSPEAITGSGYQLATDLDSIVRALQLLTNVSDVGQWQPVGPEGACVGGGIIFTLRLDSLPCGE